MLVAEGGEYLDKDGKPAFNSEAGVRALDWFVNLYKAKAVPAGTTNYLWDDLGQGFASGTVAIDLDWPGWAGFFNDPKSSKVAGNVGVEVQPTGSSGKHTGWSGHHGFSVTENLRQQGGRRLAGLVADQRGQPEARSRRRPAADPHGGLGLGHRSRPQRSLQEGSADAPSRKRRSTPSRCRSTPQWIEISNVVYPELQAAILGDKTSKQALDDAADKATQILQGRRQALERLHQGRRPRQEWGEASRVLGERLSGPHRPFVLANAAGNRHAIRPSRDPA